VRKEIAFSLIPVALIEGFFAGREFPRHYYERFGSSPFMYDRSTGKTCDPRNPAIVERDKQWVTDTNPPCGSE
jgi:hypothetical protein